MATVSELTSSMQDYLETILELVREEGAARVRDIAGRMGVRSSTVSNALHAMARRQLVEYEPYQLVRLTDSGRKIAGDVSRRHKALRKFFVEVLGMDSRTAGENACRIEHDIDEDLLGKLVNLAEFLVESPHFDREKWLGDFLDFCKQREREAEDAAQAQGQ